MVCHGQHTYVYAQVLLSVLAHENKGGHIIKRLQEEIQKEARRAHHDVTPITMALLAGSFIKCFVPNFSFMICDFC